MSCVVFMFIGLSYKVFSSHTTYFYSQNSVLTICRAVCFFMMFKTIKLKENRFINKLSKTSFGVYLIHDSNLLRPFLWKNIFHNNSYQNTVLIIPYSIVVVLLVYFGCSLFDFVRINCFERLFMKRVDNSENKIVVKIAFRINSFIYGKDNI